MRVTAGPSHSLFWASPVIKVVPPLLMQAAEIAPSCSPSCTASTCTAVRSEGPCAGLGCESDLVNSAVTRGGSQRVETQRAVCVSPRDVLEVFGRKECPLAPHGHQTPSAQAVRQGGGSVRGW